MFGIQSSEQAPRAAASWAFESNGLRWYAIQTRHRHEKRVDARLRDKGFITFLPLARQIRRWSDRCKEIELPLFPCYAFVRLSQQDEMRVAVLQTPGVVQVVGIGCRPTPIPDKQIEDIQKVVTDGGVVAVQPFCAVGQRVRITGGCFDGIEGIVQERNNSRTLMIAVEPLQRSVVIFLENYQVVPL